MPTTNSLASGALRVLARLLSLGLPALALMSAMAASAREVPSFRPAQLSPGTLRIWGTPYMSEVVKAWAEGFRKLHPEITIEMKLMGSNTAIPGLYGGQADVALMGREPNVTDVNGFFRPKRYKFTRFQLMNGSLMTAGKSPALAVLVTRGNPIRNITVAQLHAIATCSQKAQHRTITWGQLGVKGKWSNKPIRLYLPDIESGTGLFFLKVVTGGSHKLDWSKVVDFKDIRRADGSTDRAFEQTADALRNDPYGIAIASLHEVTPMLKPMAVAAKGGRSFVLPSRRTVTTHTYPFARTTFAFIDRPPGKPIDPKVREFLRYVLSNEGQAAIKRDHGYLPLSKKVATEQRNRLN